MLPLRRLTLLIFWILHPVLLLRLFLGQMLVLWCKWLIAAVNTSRGSIQKKKGFKGLEAGWTKVLHGKSL